MTAEGRCPASATGDLHVAFPRIGAAFHGAFVPPAFNPLPLSLRLPPTSAFFVYSASSRPPKPVTVVRTGFFKTSTPPPPQQALGILPASTGTGDPSSTPPLLSPVLISTHLLSCKAGSPTWVCVGRFRPRVGFDAVCFGFTNQYLPVSLSLSSKGTY